MGPGVPNYLCCHSGFFNVFTQYCEVFRILESEPVNYNMFSLSAREEWSQPSYHSHL